MKYIHLSAACAASKTNSCLTQRGVVLPLALFLLVVISIIGIMVISNSTQSEKTVQSLRSNAMAQQSAEIALRYCEDLVMQKVDDVSSTRYTAAEYDKVSETDAGTQDAGLWTTAANWKVGTALNVVSVPASVYKKNVSGDLKTSPTCIAQKLGSAGSYLITARGFGNDAIFDTATGKVKSGAEIWLQSVITPES